MVRKLFFVFAWLCISAQVDAPIQTNFVKILIWPTINIANTWRHRSDHVTLTVASDILDTCWVWAQWMRLYDQNVNHQGYFLSSSSMINKALIRSDVTMQTRGACALSHFVGPNCERGDRGARPQAIPSHLFIHFTIQTTCKFDNNEEIVIVIFECCL